MGREEGIVPRWEGAWEAGRPRPVGGTVCLTQVESLAEEPRERRANSRKGGPEAGT